MVISARVRVLLLLCLLWPWVSTDNFFWQSSTGSFILAFGPCVPFPKNQWPTPQCLKPHAMTSRSWVFCLFYLIYWKTSGEHLCRYFDIAQLSNSWPAQLCWSRPLFTNNPSWAPFTHGLSDSSRTSDEHLSIMTSRSHDIDVLLWLILQCRLSLMSLCVLITLIITAVYSVIQCHRACQTAWCPMGPKCQWAISELSMGFVHGDRSLVRRHKCLSSASIHSISKWSHERLPSSLVWVWAPPLISSTPLIHVPIEYLFQYISS